MNYGSVSNVTSLSRSEGVDELRVLLVRQVQPLLVLQPHVTGRGADLGFLLVLVDAVEVDECEDSQTNTPTDDDGHFGRNVAWSIAGTESLRACNVSVKQANREGRVKLINDVTNTISD